MSGTPAPRASHPAASVRPVALWAAALLAALLAAASALPAPAAASRDEADTKVRWRQVFNDSGRNPVKLDALWHVWGTNNTITRTSEGMRVASGPTYRNADRVALFAEAEVGTADVRVQYDYTKNETVCGPQCPERRTGLASMLLMSVDGTGTIPTDPTTTTVGEPSLALVNANLDGLRITYSTAWNQTSPALNDQIRLHLVPGNVEVPPPSPTDFVFTPGVTYQVTWEKVGDTLSVSVRDLETRQVQTHAFTHPQIALKDGKRVGLYQMPLRDATYARIKIWERRQ